MSILWLALILQIIILCQGIENKGTLLYKITSEALNKAKKQLLEPPNGYFGFDDYKPDHVTGQLHFGLNYTLIIKEKIPVSVKPIFKRIKIRNGELRILVELPKSEVHGTISVDRGGVEYFTGPFEVTFKSLLIDYRGRLGNTDVKMTDTGNAIDWDFSRCEIDMDALNIFTEEDFESVRLAKYLTDYDRNKIYKKMLCNVYPIKISLGLVGFTESISTLHFGMLNNSSKVITKVKRIEIHGGSLYLTMDVKSNHSSFNESLQLPLPDTETNEYVQFPTLTGQSERYPYEVAFNVHIFDKIFLYLKKKLGIGQHPVSILPLVSENITDELNFESDNILIKAFAPKIEWIFPNSTVKMLLTDANFSFNINEGEMIIKLELAINADVTLNCDSDKTYIALNFTTTILMLAQVGSDNEFLTLKVMGLEGNMFVWDSNIEHVVDGQLKDTSLSLPSFISSTQWEQISNLIGIPLKDFIPPGLKANISQISLTKDYVVVGCNLEIQPDDIINKLNRTQITWYGKQIEKNETYLTVTDFTPVNLQPMNEQFCNMAPNSAGEYNISYKRVIFLVFLPFITILYM